MANDKTTAPQVDFSRLPRHVAIILDGNGRWAKKRGLPRTAGHAYGAEAFRRIGNYCKAIGIEYLTVYAFSTENWRRPPEEVRTIMSIFDKYMKEALSIMERDKFKMRFFGERSGLSPELQRLMAAAAALASILLKGRLSLILPRLLSGPPGLWSGDRHTPAWPGQQSPRWGKHRNRCYSPHRGPGR